MNYSDNPYQIHALRKRIGEWLTNSDCRVALRESNGDPDRAIEWIMNNGILYRIRDEIGTRAKKPKRDPVKSLLDWLS